MEVKNGEVGELYVQFKAVRTHPRSLMIPDLLPSEGELIFKRDQWAFVFKMETPNHKWVEYVASIIRRKGTDFFMVEKYRKVEWEVKPDVNSLMFTPDDPEDEKDTTEGEE